ncbi:LamG domain-containing protein [Umezawaea sp. Da 62-37]|uniref:LamG domain-containing protein n=1 Tax=Umezawaea sp. Da 62-37 TaxID=3075927 RepID=UPI0028F73DD9|nr:LamG domain-containing protein [Umezawaea sp. Da 62-37]WNV89664.1 LamG domain-containing protein [Umezawaea sp. Da 62-37]
MRLRITARGLALRASVLGLVLALGGGALPVFAAEAAAAPAISTGVPDQPKDLGLEGYGPGVDNALPCATGEGRPVVATRTPRLRARLSAPGDGVIASGFRVFTGTVDDHTWNNEDIHADFVSHGSFAEVTVPDGWLVEAGVYSWQVWAGGDDPAVRSYSELCEFEVDTTAPPAPTVSSTDYPAGVVAGSPGRTGVFTISSGGSADVVRYGWSLNRDNGFEHRVGTGGTTTILVTPDYQMTNTLYVTAFDRAGNQARTTYSFIVDGPTAPTGVWELDEADGTTAADSSGGDRPLALSGGALFGAGHSGNALVTDGAGSFGATTTAVVDPAKAFSIAAWVRLDAIPVGSRTAVSQDGAGGSAFALRYDADANRWAMTAQGAAGSVSAHSSAAPEVDDWTHLTGTYEPDSRELSLYVNGRLEGGVEVDLSTGTPGPLVVGAGQENGARVEHFAGSIDQVAVWDRLISPAEVAAPATTPALLARYALDEQTGTTAGDKVSGQEGALSGDVTWANGSAHFGPSTGRIALPRPAGLHTDRSYSVSAWVRNDGFGGADHTAVSADDPQTSRFALGYRADPNKWTFTVSTPTGPREATAATRSSAAKWVLLTGVYDATRGSAALYVNATLDAEITGVTGVGGADGLVIGHGTASGAPVDFWNGDVDDVTVHSGVLTSAAVALTYNSTRHS